MWYNKNDKVFCLGNALWKTVYEFAYIDNGADFKGKRNPLAFEVGKRDFVRENRLKGIQNNFIWPLGKKIFFDLGQGKTDYRFFLHKTTGEW